MTVSSSNNTSASAKEAVCTSAVIESPVTPVEAEPLGEPVRLPEVETDRRLSWLAWLAAIVLFIFNKKLGLLFFVILLVFRQYPRLNLKSLAGRITKSSSKNRS